MSCIKCGSLLSQCGCASSCNSSCQETVPSCPTPYYAEAQACLEDHCKITVKASYAASLKVSNAFNMPGCSQSAELHVPGLTQASVGSYVYNQSVGYLQIVAFNAYTQKITVQNNCQAGNAVAGTTFPACTEFIVTDPPAVAGGGSPSGIFVDVPGFTAPAVGDCILIAVTGTAGLAVGKNVSIGSGTYRLDSILDGQHIVICNDGAGITPGTAVVAKDGAGNYQYPITLIDVNACTNTAVAEGKLIVCKDGISQPLDSAAAGQIPVSIDADGTVEFQYLNIPTSTCATITCCLTLIAGMAGPYVIPVSDSSQFAVTDVLQIGTRTDRFTVTAIPDATTIVGNLNVAPGATVDIPPGTSICIIDCCEDLSNTITGIITIIGDLDTRVTALECPVLESQMDIISESVGDVGGVTIKNGNPPFTGTTLSRLIENASTCRNMVANLTFLGRIFGNIGPDDDLAGTIRFGLDLTITFANPADPVIAKTYTLRNSWKPTAANAADRAWDVFMTVPIAFDLAPGQSATVEGHVYCEWVAGTIEYDVVGAPNGGVIELMGMAHTQ